MLRILFLLPLLIFVMLVGFLGFELAHNAQGDTPDIVPSVLIGKPAPAFDLSPILANKQNFKAADLKGKVTLVNFFATWCAPCRAEHPILMRLSGKGAVLAGVAYKDPSEGVKKWFAEMGNPYDIVSADNAGRTAIDFGTYGLPDSYLIDKQGVIRFKQTGPLTPEVIRDQLLPLIKELNNER